MRKIYETAIILIGTLGWWGFVYPELCLTEEAYQQEESSREEDRKEGRKEKGLQVGELCIKSRAAEYVYEYVYQKNEGMRDDKQKRTNRSV